MNAQHSESPGDGGAKATAARFVDRNTLPLTLFAALVVGCVVVAALAQSYSAMRVAPALLWGLAFCAAGILLGFIFAIPRVPTTVAEPIPKPVARGRGDGTAAEASAGRRRTATQEAEAPALGADVNSNLVEVSDWLTKIIVGVGLVEAKSLPAHAESIAAFVAPSLGIATELATPVVGGILLYFSVLGFLGGYLLTRVYIALLFKSVDVMIRNQGQTLRLQSGREIDSGKLALLQQSAIEDVQRTIASLPPEQLKAASRPRDAIAAPATRRVLWVDDHPDDNALLVDQLMRAGISVDQVRSSADAMRRLDGPPVDVVISDMMRDEGAGPIENAGVMLIRMIRAHSNDLPVLVYCDASLAKRHGAEAEQAGATLVTSSETRLLAELKRTVGPF